MKTANKIKYTVNAIFYANIIGFFGLGFVLSKFLGQ